jgi:hypothetical protein
MMDSDRLDTLLSTQGYVYIGGVSQRAYLHAANEEILKVAVVHDDAEYRERLTAFGESQEAGQLYAHKGLMPEVLEVGGELEGMPYPYLRERYISGTSLSAAFLESPRFWVSHLPRELGRIYGAIRSRDAVDVRGAFESELRHLTRPAGYDTIHRHVQEAGEYLFGHHTRGYRIHGDLRFDAILATDEPERPGHVMLMNWENSRMMTLGYEFASLYVFLVDPMLSIETDTRMQYEEMPDLRDLWLALSPILRLDLEIEDDEFWASVLFRMGSAWLRELAGAMRRKEEIEVAQWEERLLRLVSKEYLQSFPYAVTGA